MVDGEVNRKMIFFSKDKVSPKWKWNIADLQKMGKNALIFISPAILIYLAQVQGSLDNLTWSSLVPNQMTIGAIWAWLLGIIVDGLRKLSDGK